jgi:intron-binding protein aquarius
VLLSLVRTQHIGHIRDVRRLVVAMSRARLGLYVFGRKRLFTNCYELAKTFQILLQKPTSLALVKNESYGNTTRKVRGEFIFSFVYFRFFFFFFFFGKNEG